MRAHALLLLPLGLAALAGCADRNLPTSAAPEDARLLSTTAAAALVPSSAVCTVRQITTNGADQVDPAVSGNRIVWTDRRNDNGDIYAYDLTTMVETPIVSAPGDQYSPAIDGDRLAWVDLQNNVASIHALDLSGGTETPITSGASGVDYPAVSGSVVVWRDSRNDLGDIYTYDLKSGAEIPIVVDPGLQDEPDISGNELVWTDYGDFAAGDIRAMNLTNLTTTDITNDPTVYQAQPAVSGNIVVWSGEQNGQTDIYAYDLSTNQETRLTDTPENESQPDISGNTVVFQRERANPREDDIIAYDLTTGTETAITDDAAYQQQPAISGDVIVWTDNRNGNNDIYARVCGGTIDPVQAIGALIQQVEGLGPDGSGVLNQGQTNGLTRKLNQALSLLDRGKTGDAVEVLLDFRQQVLDLEADGVLSASDSEALVDAVDPIVSALRSS